MPRSINLSAQSPHPVTHIQWAFAHADYWRSRLAHYDVGAPTLDSLTTDEDGTTTVEITMRFGGDQLPAVLRPLRLGALRVIQRERWRPVHGGLSGDVTIAALRTPISGRGRVELTPSGHGTHLAGTAAAEVKVPLLGGAIAGFFNAQIADVVGDFVRVTDAWLTEHPR
ncbi:MULTISPECIES: DUF2505 domain-containing protein [unclassified Mycobacterium]|uniref:DUF2505 domain-containing protein n=1 Tax=unclassified Mycobacterium TaxID=2642494 RepID=UPI0029C6E33E|nr:MULTISPECIES: DUF2505 domain-containing protein [unclassified Mycobacterium]